MQLLCDDIDRDLVKSQNNLITIAKDTAINLKSLF